MMVDGVGVKVGATVGATEGATVGATVGFDVGATVVDGPGQALPAWIVPPQQLYNAGSKHTVPHA